MKEIRLSKSEMHDLAEKLFHETHPFSGSIDSHPRDLLVYWLHDADNAIDHYNSVNEFLHERGLTKCHLTIKFKS